MVDVDAFAAVRDYFIARKQIATTALPYHRDYLSTLAQHLMTSSWRPTNPDGNRRNREHFLDVLRVYAALPSEDVPYGALRAGFAAIGINTYDSLVDRPRGHSVIEHLPALIAEIQWRCPNETLDTFLDAFANACFSEARRK